MQKEKNDTRWSTNSNGKDSEFEYTCTL